MDDESGSAEPQLGVESSGGGLGPGTPKGWYTRGGLPHADFPGLVQSITYRLADSLPKEVVQAMHHEIESLPPEQQDAERRKRVESLLENGYGCCALDDPETARCVIDTWKRFSPERYQLFAWVVMPNHVHVLVHVREGWQLGRIVQSWKSYTGRRLMATHGVGWMREYWDRYIRDERHFAHAVAYIHNNPVKAALAARPEDWSWSSAHPGNAEPRLGMDGPAAELGLGAPRETPE